MENYCSDKSFEDVFDNANAIAEELKVEPNVAAKNVRTRRKLKMFEYESKEEPILDPKSNSKINFYNCNLDQAISSTETRFETFNKFNNIFVFL